MEDIFYHILADFQNGKSKQAFQTIIKYPSFSYEKLQSQIPVFQYLINYLDAYAFMLLPVSLPANLILQKMLQKEIKQSQLIEFFLNKLKWEEDFINIYNFSDEIQPKDLNEFFINLHLLIKSIKNKEKIKKEEILEIINLVPSVHKDFVGTHLDVLKEWKDLVQVKPFFPQICEKIFKIDFFQPKALFAYQISPDILPPLKEGETPLIFMEPLEGADYKKLLESYVKEKAIFVFINPTYFLHFLQYPDVVHLLKQSKNFIYFLDSYPNEQILAQESYFDCSTIKVLKPIFLVKRPILEEILPLFVNLLLRCFDQSKEELNYDSNCANWLYQVSKRALFRLDAHKYGKDRYNALLNEFSNRHWLDIHKALPSPKADLGPLPYDYLKERVDFLLKERKVRNFEPMKKIKLAHIVPQIISHGHAPTRILYNLIQYSDRSWFDLFLFSTERMVYHELEYPLPTILSPPSNIIGNEILHYLNSKGIKIYVEPNPSTFEETAKNVSKILHDLKIDIAVFHGPDIINNLCSAMCDVPIRILFEHGTPPPIPCYDLAILSEEDTWNHLHDHYLKQGMESCALEFCIDPRATWEVQPYQKESLGFPEGSFIMTTISNHLEDRLSLNMCQAIGKILERCSKAIYAPMGEVKNEQQFRKIFEKFGVNERVIFLGSQKNPSQLARSMNLYLNEFPFGSCLGMLDAMASGCPVVSMYDELGPIQSKYGGSYFGMDKVIRSGKVEDYVNLACELIENPDMYEEWKVYTLKQFSNKTNVPKYVAMFEKILENYIEFHLSIKQKD